MTTKKLQKRLLAAMLFGACSLMTITLVAQTKPAPKKPAAKIAAINPNQEDAETFERRKFTVIDSSMEYWQLRAFNLEDYRYKAIKTDSAGNFYSVLEQKKDVSKNQLMRLMNGYFRNWEPFETGIENTKYMSLHEDGQGNLFVKSDDGLYKLGNNKWDKIFSWYKGVETSIPFPKADGGLYARITDWNDVYKKTCIVKYENGQIKHLGKDGKPLYLMSFDDWFVVGRDGVIYSYYSHPIFAEPKTKTTSIYQWNGSEWKITGIMPEHISTIEFDNNNNLYAAGGNRNEWFFKKWDGKIWTDVALPDSLNKETSYGPIFDEKKNIYFKGNKGIDHILYKLENGSWMELARDGMDKDFYAYDFIPSNGKIYAVGNPFNSNDKRQALYLHAPTWIVNKREVAKIPVQKGLQPRELYTRHLNQFYLFQMNGKTGIQNLKGETIVRPLFDKIQVVETPPQLLTFENSKDFVTLYDSDYALEMMQGTEVIYIKIPYFDKNPDKLKCFIKRHNRTCGACKGSGTVGGSRKTTEVKSDWVKGEVRQIKKLTINGYVLETTTTPGHYKESKLITETIPGHACRNCRGEGYIWEFDAYVYDPVFKKYVKSWEQRF